MLEIEIKYRVTDRSALRTRLLELKAVHAGIRHDADSYFNAPHRDFAKTDEAFRIRQVGGENYLTYKGPRIDAQTKTRREIEVPFAEGAEMARQMCALLAELSFRPVAVVKKERESFSLVRNGLELLVTLDNVEQVGSYAELEIVADDSALDQARALLFQLASELGLGQVERRSYLELLLSQQRANSPKTGD